MRDRVIHSTQDQARVDRYVGRVSLKLPPAFRAELDGVIRRNLSRMPGKATRELVDIISAQVALTLRASDFSEVLEREFLRQREADKVNAESRSYECLSMLRRKYSTEVEAFEAIAYNRRSTAKAIKGAHIVFIRHIEFLDEYEARPLRAWADRITTKRQTLRGAA